MRMPELQALAAELGVTGTSRMRKSDLVDAIQAKRQGGGERPARARRAATRDAGQPAEAPAAVSTAPAAESTAPAAERTAPAATTGRSSPSTWSTSASSCAGTSAPP
ncbi:hypothetical protein HGA09_14390 [Cellulomonas hominis]|nr:hypothetical protein [Cellulomonas hominis]